MSVDAGFFLAIPACAHKTHLYPASQSKVHRFVRLGSVYGSNSRAPLLFFNSFIGASWGAQINLFKRSIPPFHNHLRPNASLYNLILIPHKKKIFGNIHPPLSLMDFLLVFVKKITYNCIPLSRLFIIG